MKAYVLVDDLNKEINQKYKGEMTDICLMPLRVENCFNSGQHIRYS